ncbi:hypothetical protein [Nostoc sp.]|uniref:hypothetical protein n=1 Tax=Nostoc sp. TaxID=1180 RepID=UPI002FF6DB54
MSESAVCKMLGLAMDGKIGIKLSNLEKSVVFAQSTSANGKLISQTRFLCEVP